MLRSFRILVILAALILPLTVSAQWGKPRSPVVPSADGYVSIADAAFPPSKTHLYRAVWDATKAAREPSLLVPALNMAASELNAFGVAAVPGKNVKFIVVFHGPATNAILDDEHYRAKFGVPNPNLKAIDEMKKYGVQFYVCGQYLAGENIDPKTLTPLVRIASDALLVLIESQNNGYALMSF